MNKQIVLLMIVGLAMFAVFMFVQNKSQDSGEGAVTTATPLNEMKEEMVNVTKAIIRTEKGDITVELYPEAAPKTVSNFAKLAEAGFYTGIKFHRVISDFMIQGGDPLSRTDDPRTGSGGPGYSFEDEINPWSLDLDEDTISVYQARGYKYSDQFQSHFVSVTALAMANSGPNTNGSQFFIVTERDQPHLNGLHTVFGSVIEGMDVVRSIEQGDVINSIDIVK